MHKTCLQTGLMVIKLVWLLACDHIVNSKRAFGTARPHATRCACRFMDGGEAELAAGL